VRAGSRTGKIVLKMTRIPTQENPSTDVKDLPKDFKVYISDTV